MAFTVAFDNRKRIRHMNHLGEEELEERPDTDLTYLRILAASDTEDVGDSGAEQVCIVPLQANLSAFAAGVL